MSHHPDVDRSLELVEHVDPLAGIQQALHSMRVLT